MTESLAPSLDVWPLWVRLEEHAVLSRGWASARWQVAEISMTDPAHPDAHCLCLRLYRDERSAYRFNLSSQSPTLFVLCEETVTGLLPRRLTTCQDAAAAVMDGNEPVLSVPMPRPVLVWNERFMAHHGELADPRAHKRRVRGVDRGRTAPGASAHD